MIRPPDAIVGQPIVKWAIRLADYLRSERVISGNGIFIKQTSCGRTISIIGGQVGRIYTPSEVIELGNPSATNQTLIYEPLAASPWYYSNEAPAASYPPTRMVIDLKDIDWPLMAWRLGG